MNKTEDNKQNQKQVSYMLLLPKALHSQIKIAAVQSDMSIKDFIIDAVKYKLDVMKKTNGN